MNKIPLLLALLATCSLGPACNDSSSTVSTAREPLLNSPVTTIACNDDCFLNSDCGIGEYCSAAKHCEKAHLFCANERWSVNDRGEMTDCGLYRCDSATGRCFDSAQQNSARCAGGAVADIDFCVVPRGSSIGSWQDENPRPVIHGQRQCAKECSFDTHCAAGQMCYGGKCVIKGGYCLQNTDETWRSVVLGDSFPNAAGKFPRAQSGCGNFTCNEAEGTCRTRCINENSALDCAPGHSCDPSTQQCI